MDKCKRWERAIGHRVREATVRFGCDPRHVSWMAIPCPRAATGDDCPASPQGAPLTPGTCTHKHTHTSTPTPRDLLVDEQYGWLDRIHDPKIATVRPATRCKTHAVKADHHKISAIKSVHLFDQCQVNGHKWTHWLLGPWPYGVHQKQQHCLNLVYARRWGGLLIWEIQFSIHCF